MQDKVIYTFKLNLFQDKKIPTKQKLSEKHNLLKNPSFNELNKLISEYPSSPPISIPTTRPTSKCKVRSTTMQSSRSRERICISHDELYKECTFQPNISRNLNGKENSAMSIKEKLKFLSKPKTEIIEQREKLKINQEIMEAAKYSYAPDISNYLIKNKIPIEQRIYDNNNKVSDREKLKRKLEEEKVKECTFHPKIISRRSSMDEPIHKRVESIQIEKIKNLMKIRKNSDRELKFVPKINAKSRAMSLSRRSSTGAASPYENDKYSIIETQRNSTDMENMAEISLPKRNHYDFTDFFNRQNNYSNNKQNSTKKSQQNTEAEYNFKPAINRNSSIIVETLTPPRSQLEKLKRLSDNNAEKLKNQHNIREGYFSQFNYSPDINENSRRIGRVSSLDNLATNTSKINIRKIKEDMLNKDVIENCTFSPDIISKNYYNLNIKSTYDQNSKIMKNIKDNIKAKNEKNKAIRCVKDYEELRNCSFKPTINEKINYSHTKQHIKGIDRFFELKEMARKLSSEKLERENKVNLKHSFYFQGGLSSRDFNF